MRNTAVRSRIWITLLGMQLLALNGCVGISDCKYELGQKIRTSQAWNAYNHCHEECFSCDYRDGWKAGYFDVATGGEGCPPLIAPRRYWRPPVFCQHDPSRRDEWYCGYQDGAACAKTQPDFHYLKLWVPMTSATAQMVSHHTVVPDLPAETPILHEVPAESAVVPDEAAGSSADQGSNTENPGTTEDAGTTASGSTGSAPMPPESAPVTEGEQQPAGDERPYEEQTTEEPSTGSVPSEIPDLGDLVSDDSVPTEAFRGTEGKPEVSSYLQVLLMNATQVYMEQQPIEHDNRMNQDQAADLKNSQGDGEIQQSLIQRPDRSPGRADKDVPAKEAVRSTRNSSKAASRAAEKSPRISRYSPVGIPVASSY